MNTRNSYGKHNIVPGVKAVKIQKINANLVSA